MLKRILFVVGTLPLLLSACSVAPGGRAGNTPASLPGKTASALDFPVKDNPPPQFTPRIFWAGGRRPYAVVVVDTLYGDDVTLQRRTPRGVVSLVYANEQMEMRPSEDAPGGEIPLQHVQYTLVVRSPKRLPVVIRFLDRRDWGGTPDAVFVDEGNASVSLQTQKRSGIFYKVIRFPGGRHTMVWLS